MSAVEKLLSRLDKVKRTRQDRWIARCPAHDDRGPSLSIWELDDGRVLLNCFAGCDVYEVLSAVGLEISDLFPDKPLPHCKPERRPFPAADVLRCLAHEALVVAAAVPNMLDGRPFSEADRERLIVAASRIQAAVDVAGCAHG